MDGLESVQTYKVTYMLSLPNKLAIGLPSGTTEKYLFYYQEIMSLMSPREHNWPCSLGGYAGITLAPERQ